MKAVIGFFVKTIFLTLVLSQATTSDTGRDLISHSINEPLFLTVCGVALLLLGLLGRSQRI